MSKKLLIGLIRFNTGYFVNLSITNIGDIRCCQVDSIIFVSICLFSFANPAEIVVKLELHQLLQIVGLEFHFCQW